MARIKIGPGMEEGNEMGPLITREHRDRVASYLQANAAHRKALRSRSTDAWMQPVGATAFFSV